MSTEDLQQAFQSVRDEVSLLDFLDLLATDAFVSETLPVDDDGRQGAWANQTISGFLAAAHAWAEDSSFGRYPGPKPGNPWQQFAMLLWAGRSHRE